MCNFSEVVGMHLDENDKERIVKVIREVLRLSQKVRTDGLLSLDTEIISIPQFLLRKGVELVLDGNYPGKIREILDNYIKNGNFKGVALLERLIIKEGVLLIQSGDNSRFILEYLCSMLGESFCIYVEGLELLKVDEKFFLDHIQDESFSAGKETDWLEDEILKVKSFEDMDSLIRRVGTDSIALALKGASSDTIKHVFFNISERRVLDDIKLAYKYLGPVRLTDVQNAQKKVVSTINI